MQSALAPMSRTARQGPRPNHGLGDGWESPLALVACPDRVLVFDEQPDLLCGLDDRTSGVLRRRVAAPKLWIDEGAWTPPALDELPPTPLGLLIVEGLLLRTIELDGRQCPEVVGVGDIIRPWQQVDGSVAFDTTWTAVEPSAVAVLDARFGAIAGRWPSIAAELMARATERSRGLAFQLAIAHVRHAELRLHMLFWHLADRWGRVTPEGVHLPLRLTHDTLAQLACMRRPTASTAVQRLWRAGEVQRCCDGSWLLTGAPPESRAG